MIKFASLFTACFLYFAVNSQAQNENEVFTILSYNVENLFDTINDPTKNDDEFTPSSSKNWNSPKYFNKLDSIAKVIISVNPIELPEIVGFSEVENIFVLNDLFKRIAKNNEYGILHKESPDKRGIDVALAYRKDEFEILNTEFLAVHFPFEPETTTRDILYTKGIASKIDTFHIFVNHWSSRRGGFKSEKKRVVAAKIVRTKIDSIQKINKDAKIILIGDFNDEPTNYSLTRYLQANNKKINAKYFELYNLMYDLSNSDSKGTYSFKNKWDMIDNLIVSQSLLKNNSGYSTEFTSGKIFEPNWLIYYNAKANIRTPSKTYGGKYYYGGFSDHLPVYFQLTIE